MTSRTPLWEINQPDFRCSQPKPIKLDNGKTALMRECAELIGSRWEGFVSISRPGAAPRVARQGRRKAVSNLPNHPTGQGSSPCRFQWRV